MTSNPQSGRAPKWRSPATSRAVEPTLDGGANWPVLVTGLGWLALLSGLARMFFPAQLAAIAMGVRQSTGLIIATAVVLLVLGAFLSFKGYSRY